MFIETKCFVHIFKIFCRYYL